MTLFGFLGKKSFWVSGGIGQCWVENEGYLGDGEEGFVRRMMASGGMWKWKIWHFKHLRSVGLETWPLTLQGFLPWTGWATVLREKWRKAPHCICRVWRCCLRNRDPIQTESLGKRIYHNLVNHALNIKLKMSTLMQTQPGRRVLPIIRAHRGSWGLIGNLKAPNGHQSYIMSPATFFNVLGHYYMPTFHYALILANALHSAPSCALQSFQCLHLQHNTAICCFFRFSFPRLRSQI